MEHVRKDLLEYLDINDYELDNIFRNIGIQDYVNEISYCRSTLNCFVVDVQREDIKITAHLIRDLDKTILMRRFAFYDSLMWTARQLQQEVGRYYKKKKKKERKLEKFRELYKKIKEEDSRDVSK